MGSSKIYVAFTVFEAAISNLIEVTVQHSWRESKSSEEQKEIVDMFEQCKKEYAKAHKALKDAYCSPLI